MKFSYNWLKSYVPEIPEPEKLAEAITYHLFEVEDIENKTNGDVVFDIKILPNRAHDLLSHQGLAREIAGFSGINFKDPTSLYKIPESIPTNLKIEVQSDKCRRYMGRIVRGVTIGPSPDWMVTHLESIGQRSINNIVDATNIVMFDCGQPTHVFDADKIANNKLYIANAKKDEKLILLGGKEIILDESVLTIRDEFDALDIAGIKGGAKAELDLNTKNINISIANFNPVSIRKTSHKVGVFTDAVKRFENDLSPELDAYAMIELSGLILEMCPSAIFEDIVDIYPQKQEAKKLSFTTGKVSKILGLEVSTKEIEDILQRYNFKYKENSGIFEMEVPFMRLDLEIEEDMAEEIGRILGYDKLKPNVPKIKFTPKINEIYEKIKKTRSILVGSGYREVTTYTFTNKGDVEVLASASDKKFLRYNLIDGLRESYELNKLNLPLLGQKEIKIFEIGTVFIKDCEEIHFAYKNKDGDWEDKIEKFSDTALKFLKDSLEESNTLDLLSDEITHKFKMWSLYPFITRDIAVWVPDDISSDRLKDIYRELGTELLVRPPKLFDQFTKNGKTSYAYRLVFQSYERTLTDDQVNGIMSKIADKIRLNEWEVR